MDKARVISKSKDKNGSPFVFVIGHFVTISSINQLLGLGNNWICKSNVEMPCSQNELCYNIMSFYIGMYGNDRLSTPS